VARGQFAVASKLNPLNHLTCFYWGEVLAHRAEAERNVDEKLQLLQDACSRFLMSFTVNKVFLRGVLRLADTTIACAWLCKDAKRAELGEHFFRTAAKYFVTALQLALSRSSSHASAVQLRMMQLAQEMADARTTFMLVGATELCKAMATVFLSDPWCRILWVQVLLRRVQVITDSKAKFNFQKGSTQAGKKLLLALRLDSNTLVDAILIADEQWKSALADTRLFFTCSHLYCGTCVCVSFPRVILTNPSHLMPTRSHLPGGLHERGGSAYYCLGAHDALPAEYELGRYVPSSIFLLTVIGPRRV